MTRVSPVDIEAAQSVPIAAVVGQYIALNRQGFALCPFHNERSPSFHVEPKRNIAHCFGCGVTCNPITFLQKFRQLDFVAAVRELAGRALEPSPRAAHPLRLSSGQRLVSPASAEYIASLWRDADHPELAELYLASRGINLRPKPLPWALRGHHRVRSTETNQYRPAMLAAVSDAAGAITALQRIWCERTVVSDNGVSSAKGTLSDLVAPKKVIGPMGAGAVRLAEPAAVLGLAEGVETALSASQLYRLPVWATLGAQRLGSIDLPDVVKKVVIFGDNGTAGEKAAAAAVSLYRRRGYQCEAVFPESGNDFNDLLSVR